MLLTLNTPGAACSDTRAKGIDTVICLDTSASMKGPLLRQAKSFILKFVDGELLDNLFYMSVVKQLLHLI